MYLEPRIHDHKPRYMNFLKTRSPCRVARRNVHSRRDGSRRKLIKSLNPVFLQ